MLSRSHLHSESYQQSLKCIGMRVCTVSRTKGQRASKSALRIAIPVVLTDSNNNNTLGLYDSGVLTNAPSNFKSQLKCQMIRLKLLKQTLLLLIFKIFVLSAVGGFGCHLKCHGLSEFLPCLCCSFVYLPSLSNNRLCLGQVLNIFNIFNINCPQNKNTFHLNGH